MVVERDAGAQHVQDGGPLVGHGTLDQWRELFPVAGKAPADVGGAQGDGQLAQVDGGHVVDLAALHHRALVRGGRELALGETVHAVVLDDVGDVHVAAHHVAEVAEPDGRGVAVTGNSQGNQGVVADVGPGGHRRHAPVHRVDAEGLVHEVVGGLGGAADAAQLDDLARVHAAGEERAHDGRRDRVMAAAAAHGGFRPLVVLFRQIDAVCLCHDSSTFVSIPLVTASRCSSTCRTISPAVAGSPS